MLLIYLPRRDGRLSWPKPSGNKSGDAGCSTPEKSANFVNIIMHHQWPTLIIDQRIAGGVESGDGNYPTLADYGVWRVL